MATLLAAKKLARRNKSGLNKRSPSPAGRSDKVDVGKKNELDEDVKALSFDPHTQNMMLEFVNQLKGANETKVKTETTHSNLGPSFVKFFEDLGMEIQAPDVEVCFKILCVGTVAPLEHSFVVEFIVMFDWQDPSICTVPKHDVDLANHFTPKIDFDNCTSKEFVGGEGQPRIKDHATGRLTMTLRLLATMRTRFDLALFPFDSQVLEIRLKSRHASRNKKTYIVKMCNPQTWRFKNGHKLASGADWLSEWDIVKFDGAPDGKKQDEYRLQIQINRDSRAAFWRLIFSLSSILLLSFTAFGVSVDDLPDRSSITMTMMLALVAFKFILADELPKVPYLTVMDKFIVSALLTLITQGVVFWFVADVSQWGGLVIGHYRVSAERLDDCFLKLMIMAQLGIHIWLAFHMHASSLEVMRKTNTFCTIADEKEAFSHEKAVHLHDTAQLEVYNSPEFTRPYAQKILVPVLSPHSNKS